MPTVSLRLARVLLAVAVTGTVATVVCGVGWLRARKTVDLARLSAEQRLALAGELRAVSPGIFEETFYEPRISYTFRRRARLNAWGHPFDTNRLGFRAGPVKKPRNTLRVLFVGDSWTFGMGVALEQAFPSRFAALAEQAGAVSAAGRRIEAWPLAMPGWNLMNELAALEYFFDLLDPDVVVVSPTINDVDSGAAVLPDGSLSHQPVVLDEFQSRLPLGFHSRLWGSFLFQDRWAATFSALHDVELRLERRGVPLFLFFTATWDPAFVDALIKESRVGAPYYVIPPDFTASKWRNPPPLGHPTPAAHELYAQLLYRELSDQLGWPSLPGREPAARSSASGRLDGEREAAYDWVPGRGSPLQCLTPLMSCATGEAGRGAAFVLRHRPTAKAVVVSLRPWGEPSLLDPLPIVLSVPSPSGGTRREAFLDAADHGPVQLRLPLPSDLADRRAFELLIECPRTRAAPKGGLARAFVVERVDQE